MARKPLKGYYVKGTFVAEGSELDLELQRERRGSDEASRTELKQHSTELQKLGEALIPLREDLLERLDTPPRLIEALVEARRITDFGARRRHLQFIGKLMRTLDPPLVEALRAALGDQQAGHVHDTQVLHLAEGWRERLLADDAALEAWMRQFPGTDLQPLRALVRQARKDATPHPKGEAPRHGRAYRELFQLVREQLERVREQPDPVVPDASGALAHRDI